MGWETTSSAATSVIWKHPAMAKNDGCLGKSGLLHRSFFHHRTLAPCGDDDEVNFNKLTVGSSIGCKAQIKTTQPVPMAHEFKVLSLTKVNVKSVMDICIIRISSGPLCWK